MLFSALWKNQCWICHRIRCITNFFTEFGAEQCTFSFTGGYSAHTSQSRDVEEVWKVLDPNWFKIQLEKHFSLVGIFSSHSWSDRKENLDFINFKIKTEKLFQSRQRKSANQMWKCALFPQSLLLFTRIYEHYTEGESPQIPIHPYHLSFGIPSPHGPISG